MEYAVVRDSESELQHHGTKGMRWGVRRYQNTDGSLTPLGEKRRSIGQRVHDYKVKRTRKKSLEKARATKEANKKAAEEAAKKAEERAKKLEAGKIPAKKMTDAELAKSLDRKNKEKQYREAVLATSAGKRFVSKLWNDAIVPGMIDGGKKAVGNYVDKQLSDVLGLNKKEAKSAVQLAKDAADIAKYKKSKFTDERDLAEAKKKYKEHVEKEKREKELYDEYNTDEGRSKTYEQNKKHGGSRNYKNADSTIRVEDAEVVGEGTSSSNYKNQHGSLGSNKKPDDYYDPIDVEGEWVNDHSNTPVSNLPATRQSAGETYISGLLEDKS